MITQTQESNLIESLHLPSWFDTQYCVIVMNKLHEDRFKDHRVEWMWFEDYIPIDEMIVMDKRVVYSPIQTYPKGDLFK